MRQFTNLYPLSKTLRFELKPVGVTLDNFQASGILQQDERRAEAYKQAKKIIDRYHKAFIADVMEVCVLDDALLKEYYLYYKLRTRDEVQTKKFESVQKTLRKAIGETFKKGFFKDRYTRLWGKELIETDLPEFLVDEQEKAVINEFKKFTTYFSGFHENRRNMYSDEEKSTSVAYRLVHQNLPKYIDNMSCFEKVAASVISEKFDEISDVFGLKDVRAFFKLENYSDFLTQAQIDSYNLLIGGYTRENGDKVQGLNEYINLYNQQHKDKKDKLPKLKLLFKQILSDRESASWIPDEFTSDQEVLDAVREGANILLPEVKVLSELLGAMQQYDLEGIYIKNDESLTKVSQSVYGSWGTITQSIEKELLQEAHRRKTEKEEKYQERLAKLMKLSPAFSLADIMRCVAIEGYEKNLCEAIAKQVSESNLRIDKAFGAARSILTADYPEDKKLSQDVDHTALIKELLDSLNEFLHVVKPFVCTVTDKDEVFYGALTEHWEVLSSILTPLYNKVRNYISRKPYSLEKIKLNFKNPTLVKGWDANKEEDNTCVLLRKDGLYYLGIMHTEHRRIFRDAPIGVGSSGYEKVVYKLLPGPNKMLPKVFFSKSRIDDFKPSEEVLRIREKETFKKGDNFSLKDCHTLIDFYKSAISIHPEWKDFGFKYIETSEYRDISGFYREVEHQGYKIDFRSVDSGYVDQMVAEGKLYLFQIYNKDFSAYSKGKPNLHTMYWRALFDTKNLADVVYKLNGEAELFYRKRSVRWSDEVMKYGHHYEQLKDKFDYPIIKDRRFTVDKMQLHVPITLNFKAAGVTNVNPMVQQAIRDGEVEHIIGIDRGERHLLYLTVIDLEGNIVEQRSLNTIGQTNYQTVLKDKEKKRNDARKSWNRIENIKDLKSGYLSQVVHQVAQYVVKYKAIVVLEDLNAGFMRGRQKVERQVYQNFERTLIEKLNYLVDKGADIDAEGGLLKAYQLTNKFKSFQKLGKQSGVLFYVPAWNTSKIDPVTGFVNMFDTRYSSIEKTKAFIEKFAFIRFNAVKGYYEAIAKPLNFDSSHLICCFLCKTYQKSSI